MSYDTPMPDDEKRKWVRFFVKLAAGATLVVLLIVGGCSYLGPKVSLYKSNTEKQSVIKEQEARSLAAEFEAKSRITQAQANADAEVIRAEGLAKAQAIIAETLTEDYIRYLYIQAIEGNPNQIIYVPTEGGLPILESGRGVQAQSVPQDGG